MPTKPTERGEGVFRGDSPNPATTTTTTTTSLMDKQEQIASNKTQGVERDMKEPREEQDDHLPEVNLSSYLCLFIHPNLHHKYL
jgi:hypothetical protein